MKRFDYVVNSIVHIQCAAVDVPQWCSESESSSVQSSKVRCEFYREIQCAAVDVLRWCSESVNTFEW